MFKFENDDDRAKVDKIKESFEKHWLGLIGLSLVLRLRQHNIGYTADSVKALKEGG